MQEEYGYEDEELDEYMPNVDNIQELSINYPCFFPYLTIVLVTVSK